LLRLGDAEFILGTAYGHLEAVDHTPAQNPAVDQATALQRVGLLDLELVRAHALAAKEAIARATAAFLAFSTIRAAAVLVVFRWSVCLQHDRSPATQPLLQPESAV
jgi:hypothetical protein